MQGAGLQVWTENRCSLLTDWKLHQEESRCAISSWNLKQYHCLGGSNGLWQGTEHVCLQHLAGALEAEKLLKAGYTKQLVLLKNNLQDILISLCQSLRLENQPDAAAEANRLAQEAQVLGLFSDKLHSDSLSNTSRTFGVGRTQQGGTQQAAEEGRAADDEQRVDMHLRQNMLRSHPVMDSRATSPRAEDTLHLEAGEGDRGGSGGSSQAMSRSKSLPLSAHVVLGRSLQSSCSGLAGFNSSTLLQALQDSILQLEARASIAEAGKAAAQRQLAQARQQLAADSRAHDAELAELAEQLAHQGIVLPGASHYIGPLESRANPVSPILSPRVHSTLHEADQKL
ncbi:hypothetical protein WJX82_002241 [Trebouxia sp. C0006]